MRKLNLFLLVVITLTAICVDCYAGYFLFLMFAMPIGHYLSPFLLLFIVLSVPILFISSIVGLCKLKKWAYWIFFMMTLFPNLFLISIDIFDLLNNIIKFFKIQQIFLMSFFVVFVIYFLLPSTRKVFNK
ncbi:MAG: hypothetical protein PHO34_04475 [Candidatus Omnitrophica bacterium]|nr:hypothetical protein [Candidatus Omnitrophota bacterium]MDD5501094.1 hypothetical protein [Candidatus Omnitrophota bacterium]